MRKIKFTKYDMNEHENMLAAAIEKSEFCITSRLILVVSYRSTNHLNFFSFSRRSYVHVKVCVQCSYVECSLTPRLYYGHSFKTGKV